MSPVRVLWLIKGLGPGGAEQLLVTHAKFGDHERFAYEAAYLVPEKDHLVPRLAEHGVPAVCLDGGRAWDLRWLWRLRRRLVQRPVDVIHSHSPLPASFVRLMVRTLPRDVRPRLIYTEHNEWGKHRWPTRLLNRMTLPLEGDIVAVAEAVKATMQTRRRDDVEVIYHGVDVDWVRSQADREGVRAELGIGPDEFVVGTVANLRWEKGYDVLLEAASQVVDSYPNVVFVACGQGPLQAEVEAQHQRLRLGEHFRLLGFRDDAVRVMSGFDVFCLPSRHEGLPVVLLEASVLGVPVVATAVGGVPEFERLRLSCVPPGDVRQLRGALEDVISAAGARAPLHAEASDLDGRGSTVRLEQILGRSGHALA